MLSPDTPTDADFAPNALLHLVGLGLGRQTVGRGALASPHRPADAPAARRERLERLEQLLAREGVRAILLQGERMADAPEEPALVALAAASSARDLLTRWQRLEAYAHARQRISVRTWSEHRIAVAHHTRTETGVTPVEDFLVYGLQTALLERVLATRVDVQLINPSRQIRREGVWLQAIPPGMQAGVEFSWTPRPGRPSSPLPGDGPTRDAVRALILADPARGWTLPAVATALCVAARTLQRRLRKEGCSFARLIHDARASHASRLLTQSCDPISMIGFVSGYADQSHFTRDFKRRTTMTPALFRSAFAIPADRQDPVAARCPDPPRSAPSCAFPPLSAKGPRP